LTTTTEAVDASERLIPDDSPESSASFKHRFARLREAVLRFDHRQRLVFANPAAIRLFGLNAWTCFRIRIAPCTWSTNSTS